jgi:hypothetical protein
MLAAADGQCGAVGVGRLAALALARGRARVLGAHTVMSRSLSGNLLLRDGDGVLGSTGAVDVEEVRGQHAGGLRIVDS